MSRAAAILLAALACLALSASAGAALTFAPGAEGFGVAGVLDMRKAGRWRGFGLFGLAPPPGYPAQIGSSPFGVPLVFTQRLRDAAGEYGSTLELRLFRRYSSGGRARSYISAGCPAPPGFPGTVFTLARATFSFTPRVP